MNADVVDQQRTLIQEQQALLMRQNGMIAQLTGELEAQTARVVFGNEQVARLLEEGNKTGDTRMHWVTHLLSAALIAYLLIVLVNP